MLSTINEYYIVSSLLSFVDLVDSEEWVCLFENQLDCFFAETGMDRELDFNREDEEEREFYSWIDAFKDLVRHNNSFDTVINN